MIHRMIMDRLEKDAGHSPLERRNLFREIIQEVAIYSLSAAGFFEKAVFFGETELRIVHSLPRFSEDLDFLLRRPDPGFSWKEYRERLVDTFHRFGLNPEIRERPSGKGAIRAIMLVDQTPFAAFSSGKEGYTRIRLEIDTDPPYGTGLSSAFLDFPVPHEVVVSDLSSSFALKCHALLCRPWMKGRDWFDLLWFLARGVRPRMVLLASSLDQAGPWAGQGISISEGWLGEALARRVHDMDLEKVKGDILPFVSGDERASVESWSREIFLHYIRRAFPST